MPQVQVLERQPTLGERLGEALGTGFSQGLSEALSQYHERKENEYESGVVTNALKSLGKNPDPQEAARLILSLPIRDQSKRLYGTIATMGYRQQREERLQHQELLGQYQNQIRQVNTELKDAPNKASREPLMKKRDALKKEMQLNYRRMRKGEQPIFDVFEEGLDEEAMPDAEDGFQTLPQGTKPLIPQAKPLAPAKPKKQLTKQVAQHFMKKARGDVSKAKQMAMQQGYQ